MLNCIGEDGDTHLHRVAKKGDSENVLLLITKGAYFDIKNKEGQTPNDVATGKAKTLLKRYEKFFRKAKTQKLLNHDISYLNKNVQDKEGKTVLHHAAQRGDGQSVALLIKEGAYIYIKDKQGNTPYDVATGDAKILLERYKEFFQKAKTQVLSNDDIKGLKITVQDEYGKTALHYAAERGCYNSMRRLLLDGVSADAQDKEGKTALHYAAQSGCCECVKLLIRKGAYIDVKDEQGNTPCDVAAGDAKALIKKHTDLVDKMIGGTLQEEDLKDKDLCLNPKAIKFKTRYYELFEHDLGDDFDRADCVKEEVRKMLTESGCSGKYFERIRRGVTCHGMKEYIKFCKMIREDNFSSNKLEKFMNDNRDYNFVKVREDYYNKTALHFCAEKKIIVSNNNKYNTLYYIKLFIERGADVNAQDAYGNTPLHYAAQIDNIEAVKLLIAKGAYFNIKNKRDETPCDVATGEAKTLLARYNKLYEGVKGTIVWDDFTDLCLNAKDDYGNTPLHCAAQIGNIEAVKLLIAKGAYFNIKNEKDETPCDVATYEVKTLLARYNKLYEGVKGTLVRDDFTDLCLNAKDDKGKTVLQYATENSDNDFRIKLFIMHRNRSIYLFTFSTIAVCGLVSGIASGVGFILDPNKVLLNDILSYTGLSLEAFAGTVAAGALGVAMVIGVTSCCVYNKYLKENNKFQISEEVLR